MWKPVPWFVRIYAVSGRRELDTTEATQQQQHGWPNTRNSYFCEKQLKKWIFDDSELQNSNYIPRDSQPYTVCSNECVQPHVGVR